MEITPVYTVKQNQTKKPTKSKLQNNVCNILLVMLKKKPP